MTTVNGQFQGPLQVAFLGDVHGLKNTLIGLIPFSFFLGYLLNSSRGGVWINRRGYKWTLMRALLMMIGGVILFTVAAGMATYYNDYGVSIGSDYLSWGYFVFLFGSYLMGTSAAVMQVVINPYINAYELPGTQPVQRMNMVCAVNSFGTTIAPFFVTGVIFAGVAMSEVSVGQLLLPFGLLTLFMMVVTLVTYRIQLPDIPGTFSDKDSVSSAGNPDSEPSVWSFRQLRLGVVAIFFYVGAEVMIGVNVNLHAIELIEGGRPLIFMGSDNLTLWGLEFGIPALLATLYWGGLMVGRLLSSFISGVSARVQLVVTTVSAIMMTLIAVWTENLWVLVAVGLCHSVMWGCVFTLAVDGLGRYTSRASGVFMMGVFGGAVFPLLQSFVADSLGSWQWTWGMVVVCELVILYYALVGSKNNEKTIKL